MIIVRAGCRSSSNSPRGPVTGTVEIRATAFGRDEARCSLELAPVRGVALAERREDLVLVVLTSTGRRGQRRPARDGRADGTFSRS